MARRLTGWPVAYVPDGPSSLEPGHGFDESHRGCKLRFDHTRGGLLEHSRGMDRHWLSQSA